MTETLDLGDVARRHYAYAGAYALRAEARSLVQRRKAVIVPGEDRVWTVKALSDPWHLGEYLVHAGNRGPGRLVEFTCTCPAGTFYAHLPVPCVHAACCGHALEVARRVVWRLGLWRWPGSRPQIAVPDDPFAGLSLTNDD